MLLKKSALAFAFTLMAGASAYAMDCPSGFEMKNGFCMVAPKSAAPMKMSGMVMEAPVSKDVTPVPCPTGFEMKSGFCMVAPKPLAGSTTPINIYSGIGADNLNPALTNVPQRVYVPNHSSNTVSVIDQATMKVIDTFKVGLGPQHIIPSWDLKTLWVANNASNTPRGAMTPIDPLTSKPGAVMEVDDPYNMYFMPDGSEAVIVDEAYKRLDIRDPHTMKLITEIPTPDCHGINHADFSADYSFAIFTCEFRGGALVKVDLKNRKVLGMLELSKKGMPQDVRLSPDGSVFYVSDMMNNGVFLIDAATFTEAGFIPTGIGAHGLNVSRDGKSLYVANRGSTAIPAPSKGPGSISVIDFATRKVVANWPIEGGGSPDMGNLSVDGKVLWLSGRFDNVVYAIDTTSGTMTKIKVGQEPHGLTVWPQPGNFSLGHTGNMR
jgi:YVTN family beta-propeller protein